MNTSWLLIARYEGLAIIPAEAVCRDYFPHLDTGKFIRKCNEGDITLPLVRIEGSSKAARGVHLLDLATFIDARRAEALKEVYAVSGDPTWQPTAKEMAG